MSINPFVLCLAIIAVAVLLQLWMFYRDKESERRAYHQWSVMLNAPVDEAWFERQLDLEEMEKAKYVRGLPGVRKRLTHAAGFAA